MGAKQKLLGFVVEASCRKDNEQAAYIAKSLMEDSSGEVRLPDMRRDAGTWSQSLSGKTCSKL